MTFCDSCLKCCSLLVFIFTLPFSLLCSIKIVQEYERAVLFRIGRVQGGARGPGLFFIYPCIDKITVIDMRTRTFDVPPQEILTKDSVTVTVDSVIYYRVKDATGAVTKVENYERGTHLLASTILRTVLGTRSLAELLSDREQITRSLRSMLDEGTAPWGIEVERVELTDVRLPLEMQRVMASEAEATREARAKVISAEGEQKASRALKEASDIISDSPAALQLRYLQTLHDISMENNSTILFPIPIEMFRAWNWQSSSHGAEKL